MSHESHGPAAGRIERIVAELTWQIATGRLAPGARLPSLRALAAQWGTTVHVARAVIVSLAASDLVTVRWGSGVTVRGSEAGDDTSVEAIIRTALGVIARERRLSEAQLRSAVLRSLEVQMPEVQVVECSAWLTAAIARDIRRRWQVRTVTRFPEDIVATTSPTITTWFHGHQVRARLGGKNIGIHLVRIEIEPIWLHRLAGVVRRSSAPVWLVDTDPEQVHDVAAELARRAGVVPATVVLGESGATPVWDRVPRDRRVLFSPRLWDQATRLRDLPSLWEPLPYRILPVDLEEVGLRWGWSCAVGWVNQPAGSSIAVERVS
jgi:GntR family transcriptional regulator